MQEYFKSINGRLGGWLSEIYIARGWLKATGKKGIYLITKIGKRFIGS